jgi:hypothetical protein
VHTLLIIVKAKSRDRLTNPEEDEQQQQNEGQAVIPKESVHGCFPQESPSQWACEMAIFDRA